MTRKLDKGLQAVAAMDEDEGAGITITPCPVCQVWDTIEHLATHIREEHPGVKFRFEILAPGGNA